MPRNGLDARGEWVEAHPKFLVPVHALSTVFRARMLQGWIHSGFNVHRSRRVLPREREDLQRLAQYIMRNPFSLEKMQFNKPGEADFRLKADGAVQTDGCVIYRSGMNPKINRNFEIFTPCDFIAAITQHIPDKNFQLVRYIGWYSNKMRGQRDKRAAEEAKAAGKAVEVIDVSEHQPRRIPSAKWRELIKRVWESDPLLCPKCHNEMRIVSLIDDPVVIDLPAMLRIALQAGRILRHLGLWEQGVRVLPARACPEPCLRGSGSRAPPEIVDRVIEPCFDDPFPDYDTELVMAYANG